MRAVVYLVAGLATFGIHFAITNLVPDQWQTLAQLVTGLPFALALCRYTPKNAVLCVILDCVTWVAAYRLALWLAGVNAYFGTAAGGALGGLCVTATTGLRSLRVLILAALVGALAGAPFGLVGTQPDTYTTLILVICFPIWQIAVGLSIDRHARVR